MCLSRDIKYHSSSDSINEFENIEWPLEPEYNDRLIVACNFCFFPITFEEYVVDEIRNENNISFGLIILLEKLFGEISVFNENPLEQWRTEIYCPNCCIILSFLSQHKRGLSETDFEKISRYSSFGEQIIILWTYPLFRGSVEEGYSRYRIINEINQ